MPLPAPPRVTRLFDIVFPGDTNHHGTLFGGVGLAGMDKVAFIAASRHAAADFVTASCERVDFKAPARLGEIIEVAGRVRRVGTRSLGIEVELVAEALLSGERRLCGSGVFNMVATGGRPAAAFAPAPGDIPAAEPLRMVEMVFPGETSHYGSLYGGVALSAMGKAAFIAATRHCRRPVVLASSQRVDFTAQVHEGEVMEVSPRLVAVGRSSMTVEVDLMAEDLKTRTARHCGRGTFVMVAVDERGRPTAVPPLPGGSDHSVFHSN